MALITTIGIGMIFTVGSGLIIAVLAMMTEPAGEEVDPLRVVVNALVVWVASFFAGHAVAAVKATRRVRRSVLLASPATYLVALFWLAFWVLDEWSTSRVLYGAILSGVLLFPSYLLVWFGFQQARRRRRVGQEHLCEECDYNLRGNVSGRCPECGTSVEGKTEDNRDAPDRVGSS